MLTTKDVLIKAVNNLEKNRKGIKSQLPAGLTGRDDVMLFTQDGVLFLRAFVMGENPDKADKQNPKIPMVQSFAAGDVIGDLPWGPCQIPIKPFLALLRLFDGPVMLYYRNTYKFKDVATGEIKPAAQALEIRNGKSIFRIKTNDPRL